MSSGKAHTRFPGAFLINKFIKLTKFIKLVLKVVLKLYAY